MSASAENSAAPPLPRLQHILPSGAVRDASRLLRCLAPAGSVLLIKVTDVVGFMSLLGLATLVLI